MLSNAEPEPDIPRTQAVGLLHLADTYVESGAALVEVRDGVSSPRYFLYGHGLELAFKALLVSEGTTASQLKRLGHDLDRVLRAIERRGLLGALSLSRAERDVVSWLNSYYRGKEFEYLFTGYKEFPDPAFLDSLAQRVVIALKPRIRAAVLSHARSQV